MRSLFPIFIGSLICFSTYAGEVDHFIYRFAESPQGQEKIPHFKFVPATPATNLVINLYIELLAEKVKSCNDREEVMDKIKYIFDTNFPDVMNDVATAHKSGVSGLLSLQASILHTTKTPLYKGFDPPSYSGCCLPVVKLGETNAGLDKIDHFLSHGYMYYAVYSQRKVQASYNYTETVSYKLELRKDSEEDRMKDVVDIGLFQEESSWGLGGTGVKSYGDLAANYAGLQFYKNLFEGDNPYLKCVDNTFVVNRKFKIEDYVDDSWDESINCSSYNSKENRDVVLKNMKAMGFEKCPVDPKKCEALVQKYKGQASHILHPLCANPSSSHSQVEEPRNKILSTLKALQFLELRDIKKAAKGAK